MAFSVRTALARTTSLALAGLAAVACGCGASNAATASTKTSTSTQVITAPASVLGICRRARRAIEPIPEDTFAELNEETQTAHFFEREFLRAARDGHQDAARAEHELRALAAAHGGPHTAALAAAAARAASGFEAAAAGVSGHYPSRPTAEQNAGLVRRFERVAQPFFAHCELATR